jgi:2-dehydropantoate 2-reductase
MDSGKMSIAIMGAGAIGSVIGGMLARQGHSVTLVGRKSHMDAISQSGLHISGIWGRHTVLNLDAVTSPPHKYMDIVFLISQVFLYSHVRQGCAVHGGA